MYEWDLSALYSGFDSPSFQEDSQKLFSLLDTILEQFSPEQVERN